MPFGHTSNTSGVGLEHPIFNRSDPNLTPRVGHQKMLIGGVVSSSRDGPNQTHFALPPPPHSTTRSLIGDEMRSCPSVGCMPKRQCIYTSDSYIMFCVYYAINVMVPRYVIQEKAHTHVYKTWTVKYTLVSFNGLIFWMLDDGAFLVMDIVMSGSMSGILLENNMAG